MEKELQKLVAKATKKKLPKKLRKNDLLKILWPLITFILTALLERLNNSSSRSRQQRDDRSTRDPVTKPARQAQSRREAAAGQNLVSDSTLQAYIDKAGAYQAEINRLANEASRTAEQARLQELAGRIDTWLAAIKQLARRLDDFRQNRVVQQDLTAVPQAITKLERQLDEETDSTLRAELERTLANRQAQWTSLKNLQKSMRWAEIKIENTLSLLGTIHSQVLASQSKNDVADYRRLVDRVDEEVHGLQDHLEALDEVRLDQSALR